MTHAMYLAHRLLAAAACTAVVASCGDLGIEGEPVDVQCRNDFECTGGLSCEFDHCVNPAPNRIALLARFLPAANSGLLPQQLPAFSVTLGPDRLVTLLEPEVLRGVAVPIDDAATVNLPGDLVLNAPGDIDGFEHQFTATSDAGVDADGYGFTVQALPGREYVATFRPSDRTIPRHRFTFDVSELPQRVGREGTSFRVLAIDMPERAAYTKVTGRVRRELYDVDYRDSKVVALDEQGAVISIVTAGPQGAYEALINTATTPIVRFKVQPPSGDDAPLLPDYVTEPIDVSAIDGTYDIILPAPATGATPFTVELTVTGDLGDGEQPLPGLTVTAVGDLASGTLRRATTTDEDGVARFEALPGAYECLITPPAESTWATWLGKLTLTPDEGPTTVELSGRVPVEGTVRDAFGALVSEGKIIATRRATKDAESVLSIAPQPFQAPLRETGAFVLVVDPGVYDIRVVPDPSTGAPPQTIQNVVVNGLFDLPIRLAQPSLAHVTVARPSGEYLPGVTVELYQANGDDRPPQLLSEGTTGDNGFVDLLIPFTP